MDSNGVELNYDPLYFEHHILPLFYLTTLILGLTLPIVYLLISRLTSPAPPPIPIVSNSNSKSRFGRYRSWVLGSLAMVTAFVDLCSWTEPYNLARPVYVCFYPVRGETFRHPEETRLRIQWMCFLGASSAASGATVWDIFVWGGRILTSLRLEVMNEKVFGRREEAKGDWWMFPGQNYVRDMDSASTLNREDENGNLSQEVDQFPYEVESIHSSIYSSAETPLLTPTEDEDSETGKMDLDLSIKKEAEVHEDGTSQRDVLGDTSPRNWMWRLIGEGKKRLSKDRLMGLAWLLTVAAWLVMYGRSKKGGFWWDGV